MSIADRKKKLEAAKGFIKPKEDRPVVPDVREAPPPPPPKGKPEADEKKQANYLLDPQLKMDIQIEATRQGIWPAHLVEKVMRKYLEEKKGGKV